MSVKTLATVEQENAEKVFQMLVANTYRTKLSFTNVFIGIHPSSSLFYKNDEKVEREGFFRTQQFIETKIRKSDILFPSANRYGWLLILSATGEAEAIAFLQRLFENGPLQITEQEQVLLSAGIIEIGNSEATYSELMEVGGELIFSAFEKEPFQYTINHQYKERKRKPLRSVSWRKMK